LEKGQLSFNKNDTCVCTFLFQKAQAELVLNHNISLSYLPNSWVSHKPHYMNILKNKYE